MKTIVIISQRRSGSSMFAGILYYLGIDMGEKATPEQSSGRNPKGFFEDRNIIGISEEMTSFVMANPSIPRETLIQGYEGRIKEYFDSRKDIWGFKDVNFLDFSDIYVKYIENPYYIFVFRNPLDIAMSYSDWHKTDIISTLAMVNKNNSKIFRLIKKLKGEKLLVSYEKTLQDPMKSVNEIMNFIGYDKKLEDTKLNNLLNFIKR